MKVSFKNTKKEIYDAMLRYDNIKFLKEKDIIKLKQERNVLVYIAIILFTLMCLTQDTYITVTFRREYRCFSLIIVI